MRLSLMFGASLVLALIAFTGPRNFSPYAPTPDELARAQDYIDRYYEPMPDNWAWFTHDGPHDTAIRWGASGPTTSPVTIVYVPGYGPPVETTSHYYNHWRSAGYRVIAMDLPGQGGSTRRPDDPERAWSGDFEAYGDVLADFLTARAAETEGKLVLAAASFAGHVSIRAMMDHTLPIDGAVLITPALEIQTPGIDPSVAQGLFRLGNTIGIGRRYGLGLGQWSPNWSDDPDTATCGLRPDRAYLYPAFFTVRPELRVGGPTIEWLTGLERSGKALANGDGMRAVPYPVTMTVAEADRILINDRIVEVCDRHFPGCRLVNVPDAGHCANLEPDDREAALLHEPLAELINAL